MLENKKNETKVEIIRDAENWEVEVKAEVPAEILLSYRASALREIGKTAKIDGFRPGHAPEAEIIRVYGEEAVLRQAAEQAVRNELPEILASQELPIVEAPRVTTETPMAGKPLSFTARAGLAPEIDLPDYKEIAKKYPAPAEQTVSDKEHGDAMAHLRRERVRVDFVEKGGSPAEAAEEARKTEEKDLPPLDEEFTKSIGYENISEFHTSVRENMKKEKERQAKDIRRESLLRELVKNSTIKYPKILLDYELDDLEARLRDDLVRAGATFDAYLSQIKKSREQLRAEWKEPADKRARTRLVLSEIARRENINPDEARLAEEIEHARKHYKDASPEALRAHISHALRNEDTLRFLESFGTKEN